MRFEGGADIPVCLHDVEVVRQNKSPRKCVYCVSALGTIEQTGDSSTALRMTCFCNNHC